MKWKTSNEFENPLRLNFNHHKGPIHYKGLGHSCKPSVSGRFSIRLWAFVSSFVILKEIWNKCCSEIFVKNIWKKFGTNVVVKSMLKIFEKNEKKTFLHICMREFKCSTFLKQNTNTEDILGTKCL
jgi:hypothetical protein